MNKAPLRRPNVQRVQSQYLSGAMVAIQAEWLERESVVALNGVLWATTIPYVITPGGAAKIAFLIFPEGLRNGAHPLELFAVGENARLRPIERSN